MVNQIINKDLILRPYSANDLNDLRELVYTEDIYDVINVTSYPKDEELLGWIKYWNGETANCNVVVYAVEHNKKVIGTVSLSRIADDMHEIMYWFNEQYRNLGYATSAIKSVIKELKKTPNTKFLIGLVPSYNQTSMNILSRFGFSLNRIYKDVAKGKNAVFYRYVLDINSYELPSSRLHNKNSRKKQRTH